MHSHGHRNSTLNKNYVEVLDLFIEINWKRISFAWIHCLLACTAFDTFSMKLMFVTAN